MGVGACYPSATELPTPQRFEDSTVISLEEIGIFEMEKEDVLDQLMAGPASCAMGQGNVAFERAAHPEVLRFRP